MIENISKFICDPDYLKSHQIIRKWIDHVMIRTIQDLNELCNWCDGMQDCKKIIEDPYNLKRFDDQFFF